MPLLQTVKTFCSTRQIDALLVAVSGGADSLALLHALAALRNELGLTLCAATLDHGLRGLAGAEDADYAYALAESWDVPCVLGRVDVAMLARQWNLGTEAAARRARYDWLAGVARDHDLRFVATAHHADDQAETILLHILRGTGISGLRGMASAMRLPDHRAITLLRPLLTIKRAEIDFYCAEHGINPRDDASNDDTRYTRNHLRHDVLPLLRQINPQVEDALLRLSEIAAVDDWALQKQLYSAITEAGGQMWHDGERCHAARAWFDRMDLALQRRFFAWVSAMLKGEPLAFERVQAAITAAQRGVVGTVIELGNRLTLTIDYHELIISRDDVPPLNINLGVEGEIVVPIPGEVTLNDQRLVFSVEPLETANARLALPETARLTVRQRQRGDRFAPLGMEGHTQKVSEWMVNHKVAAALRDQIPLIMINGEIAAICWGERWAISERFRVEPSTMRIIYVQVMKNF